MHSNSRDSGLQTRNHLWYASGLCRVAGLEVEVDGRTTNVNETVELIARAADGLSVADSKRKLAVLSSGVVMSLPRVATGTNDRDRAAI